MPILLLLLTAAHAEDPCLGIGAIDRTGPAFATVDGVPVTEAMAQGTLLALDPKTRQSVIDHARTDALREQVVDGELLYAEACRRGLTAEPSVQLAARLGAREAVIRVELERIVAERTTPERIKAWYEDHLVQFARPEVKARHMLLKTRAEANRALARVRAGESFASVASQVSVDPGSAPSGGELGWFGEERMNQQFWDAASKGHPGELLGPVQTTFGWHVILVEDTRAVTPLPDVEPRIRELLQAEITDEYVAELRKSHVIGAPSP